MPRKTFSKKRNKAEVMELDITSLLDILVILLVFLLKSYNASDLKLDLVKNLTVADSKARKLGNHAVMIQVDKNQNIWHNNKKIASTNTRKAQIDELFNTLTEQKKLDRVPAKKKSKKINLVFHKNLPYKSIKKVMHTSTLAGYTEFKFIIQGNY